ncbi:MAG TPA: peptidylprolyl isomerase [Opitutaceae bacterium]|nr:peptidylprolyl isomerase [Opitutaceae bacterium]
MPRCLALLAALLALTGGAAEGDGLFAEIKTPRGTVTCELYFEKTPLTVASFVGLAEGTLGPAPRKPFFNGLKFHRVVADFVVQGGDPLGTGEGGPGYTFADEFVPGLRHDRAGVLSMANDGPDTNGSQFFLTLRDTNRLNYLHSVFGRVVGGRDVLATIQQGDTMTVAIVRRGAAARAFRADDMAFAKLQAAAKKYSTAREPGPTAHFDDSAKLLPTEPPRAKNYNYKLANFERATGIRIVARMMAKSPSAQEDKVPGAYMRALAGKLGVAQRGALLAYFADEDDWRAWLGDESTPAFVGRSATAKEFTESGAMHEAKEAFLDAARATGNADFLKQQKSAPPDRPVLPQQQLKLQADALLDGLINKLEPK